MNGTDAVEAFVPMVADVDELDAVAVQLGDHALLGFFGRR